MDPRLQELWDHHEIRQLLATYCHGSDRIDAIEMASVYCEESWDDHGRHKCDGKQYAHLVMLELSEAGGLCSHQLGQTQINVDGDTAGAETYFIATIKYPPRDGEETLRQMGGRYVDWLERENGAWKIKKRTCIREWSICHPVKEDWLATAGFVSPEPSQQDPSYDALGLIHSGIPARVGTAG